MKYELGWEVGSRIRIEARKKSVKKDGNNPENI